MLPEALFPAPVIAGLTQSHPFSSAASVKALVGKDGRRPWKGSALQGKALSKRGEREVLPGHRESPVRSRKLPFRQRCFCQHITSRSPLSC